MAKPLRKVGDRYSSELKSRIRYCKLCDRWKRIAVFEKYGVIGDKKRRRTCLSCKNVLRRARYLELSRDVTQDLIVEIEEDFSAAKLPMKVSCAGFTPGL